MKIPFVCGRFFDRYLIASRLADGMGVFISEVVYEALRTIYQNDGDLLPQLLSLFKRFNYEPEGPNLRSTLLVKEPQGLNYAVATYEITERCNYDCEHCIMGGKLNSELSLDDKMKLLNVIEEAGCMILRITGGEPLVSRGFKEFYSQAFDDGLIIRIATNGSLLAEKDWQNFFSKRPPSRITLSGYGSTQESYETLTRTKGSFAKFAKALQWLSTSGIRTRINIIVTKYNEQEVEELVAWCRKLDLEYFGYTRLAPTFGGDISPMNIMTHDCSTIAKVLRFNEQSNFPKPVAGREKCLAGKAAFHLMSNGKAAVCSNARDYGADVLHKGVSSLNILSIFSDQFLAEYSACKSCEFADTCTTCPIVLRHHIHAGVIPNHICKKGGDVDGNS